MRKEPNMRRRKKRLIHNKKHTKKVLARKKRNLLLPPSPSQIPKPYPVIKYKSSMDFLLKDIENKHSTDKEVYEFFKAAVKAKKLPPRVSKKGGYKRTVNTTDKVQNLAPYRMMLVKNKIRQSKPITKIRKNAVNILDTYLESRNPSFKGSIKPLKDRCFIMGNGPSLNNVDFSLLKDEYTIACNYYMVGRKKLGGFCPTIICAGDRTCTMHMLTRDASFLREPINEPIYVIHPSNSNLGIRGKNPIKQEAIQNYNLFQNMYSMKNMKNFVLTKRLINSKDVAKNLKEHCLVYRNVIPMISMHIAQMMGFKKIYLLGCDFDDFLQHFYKEKTNVGLFYPERGYKAAFEGYALKAKILEDNNIEVYNCNPNSKLPMFPHMTLETALGITPDKPSNNEILDTQQSSPTASHATLSDQ